MHRSLLVACALWSLAPRASAEPPPSPPPLPTIEITANRVEVEHSPSISTDILFEVGDTAIKAAARPLLDAIGKALAKDPAAIIAIHCYTDDTAPDNDRTGAYNQKLSHDRAEALLAYFTRHGVAAKRMIAKGFGRDKPVGDNATDDGKRANRRIEVVLTSEVRPPDAADLAAYTRSIKGKGALVATIATNQGTIHCQLFDDKAPIAVANFIGLATGQKPWTDPLTGKTIRQKPFYDGLIFHRVIPHFMIQGGDPAGAGTGGPGYTFDDELAPDLTHKPGTLAMANAGPSTNGSQFFIDEVEASWLNNHHTIFGQCKELDVIAKIAAVPRGRGDKPNDPVTITRITIARGAR
jgi:cyclophilin family peptidyl-prolyl cis-trans isomerase/outer membrane protein OmpA-like peptidoglycan-associated protein